MQSRERWDRSIAATRRSPAAPSRPSRLSIRPEALAPRTRGPPPSKSSRPPRARPLVSGRLRLLGYRPNDGATRSSRSRRSENDRRKSLPAGIARAWTRNANDAARGASDETGAGRFLAPSERDDANPQSDSSLTSRQSVSSPRPRRSSPPEGSAASSASSSTPKQSASGAAASSREERRRPRPRRFAPLPPPPCDDRDDDLRDDGTSGGASSFGFPTLVERSHASSSWVVAGSPVKSIMYVACFIRTK
mmetsp:Transcript_38188/g.81493  ORF Transcript_38188/g.81493 Transcript_38188/m.81493 type:complete len:249 (+) Transcript_38188:758-1504(+)